MSTRTHPVDVIHSTCGKLCMVRRLQYMYIYVHGSFHERDLVQATKSVSRSAKPANGFVLALCCSC